MRPLLAVACVLATARLALGQACLAAPVQLLPCPRPAYTKVLGAVRACVDPTLGVSRWATAWYQPSTVHQSREVCDWRQTPGMPSPDAYTGTGLDRGHLIAFGDVSCSATAAALTCQTGNIAPQPPADNRGPWAQFEARLRTWADGADNGRPIIFVAGPTFSNPVLWVRPGLARPTGFWKIAISLNGNACAYAETSGGKVRAVTPASLGFRNPQRPSCPTP